MVLLFCVVNSVGILLFSYRFIFISVAVVFAWFDYMVFVFLVCFGAFVAGCCGYVVVRCLGCCVWFGLVYSSLVCKRAGGLVLFEYLCFGLLLKGVMCCFGFVGGLCLCCGCV